MREFMICPKCGVRSGAAGDRCSGCGEHLIPACPQCKRPIIQGSAKCNSCGASIMPGVAEVRAQETAPASIAKSVDAAALNTSGQGKGAPIPPEVEGWNWGAFLFGWIWGVGNEVWISLLCFIPYFGAIWHIVLGVNGNRWAWENKRWDSVEQFHKTQRKWAIWGAAIYGGILAIYLVIFIIASSTAK